MGAARGKRLALAISIAGLGVISALGFTARRRIAEEWSLLRLGARDLEARRRAAAALGAGTTRRSLERLLELVRQDALLGQDAVGALVRRREPEAPARLLEAIGWRDADFRAEAAKGILEKARRDPAWIPAGVQIALYEPSEKVQKSASEGLQAVGKLAVPFLIEGLESGRFVVRREEGPIQPLEGFKDDAWPTVVPVDLWRALKALRGLGSEAQDAVPSLVALLSGESEVAEEACSVLVGIGDSALPALAAASRTEGSRGLAISALASIEPPPEAALPVFIEALDDPCFKVGWAAARGLGAMGPAARGAVPRLLALLRDPSFYDPEQWTSGSWETADHESLGLITEALRRIRDASPEVVAALKDALKDERPGLALASAVALVELEVRSDDLRQALWTCLMRPTAGTLPGHTPSPTPKLNAIEALERLGIETEAILRKVRGALSGGAAEARRGAIEALLALREAANSGESGAVDELLETLEAPSDPVAKLMLPSYRALDEPKVLAVLKHDPDFRVKNAVIRFLAESHLGSGSVVDALFAIMRSCEASSRIDRAALNRALLAQGWRPETPEPEAGTAAAGPPPGGGGDLEAAFRWFDSLGLVDATRAPLVRVVTGEWTRGPGGRRVERHRHGFLLREDPERFIILGHGLREETITRGASGTLPAPRLEVLDLEGTVKRLLESCPYPAISGRLVIRMLEPACFAGHDPDGRMGLLETFLLARAARAHGIGEAADRLSRLVELEAKAVLGEEVSLREGIEGLLRTSPSPLEAARAVAGALYKRLFERATGRDLDRLCGHDEELEDPARGELRRLWLGAWRREYEAKGDLRMLLEGVEGLVDDTPALAALLVERHPEQALEPLVRAARRSARRAERGSLVEAAGKVPGATPVEFLLEELRRGPYLEGRLAAAEALAARGRPEGVQAMVEEWAGPLPDVPDEEGGSVTAILPDLVRFILAHADGTARQSRLLEGWSRRSRRDRISILLGFAGQFPAKCAPAEPTPALEELLRGLLTDRTRFWIQWNDFDEHGGLPGRYLRVRDLAGWLLARLWPEKHGFDIDALLEERERAAEMLGSAGR